MEYSSYAFVAKGLQAKTIAVCLLSNIFTGGFKISGWMSHTRCFDIWLMACAGDAQRSVRSNACGGQCCGCCFCVVSPRRLGGAPECLCFVVVIGCVLFVFDADVGDVCGVRRAGSGGMCRRGDVALV